MALLGAVALLGGCAVTDVDPSADFSKYQSFGWGKPNIQVDDPAYKGGLIESRIKSNIKCEFQKRGLTYAEKKPDLLVTYQTYAEDKTVSSSYSSYSPFFYPMYPMRFYGYRSFYGWGYPYGYGMSQSAYSYKQGTLIIDINDRTTGDHIWRGMVRGNITSPSGLQKQIANAVKAIAKKYPVEAPKEKLIPEEDDVI